MGPLKQETINKWILPVNDRKNLTGRILAALILLLTFSAACRDNKMNQNNQTPSVNANVAGDPMSLHQRAITSDMRADTVQRVLDEHIDLQQELSDGHFDAVRAKAGHL